MMALQMACLRHRQPRVFAESIKSGKFTYYVSRFCTGISSRYRAFKLLLAIGWNQRVDQGTSSARRKLETIYLKVSTAYDNFAADICLNQCPEYEARPFIRMISINRLIVILLVEKRDLCGKPYRFVGFTQAIPPTSVVRTLLSVHHKRKWNCIGGGKINRRLLMRLHGNPISNILKKYSVTVIKYSMLSCVAFCNTAKGYV